MKVAVLHNRPVAEDHPLAESSRDVLEQVALVEQAMARLGHEPVRVEMAGDLPRWIGDLQTTAPDVVFNLVESVDEDAKRLANVAAVLELLGLPFTGSGATALALTTDKHLAKLALRGAGLPTPDWSVFDGEDRGEVERLPGPWIVKPNYEDASIGIDEDSIYGSASGLRAALPGLWRAHGRQPLLVERYVDGREFNVSVLDEAGGLRVLPLAEIDFSAFAECRPKIVGYRAKWDAASFEYNHTPRRFHHDSTDCQVSGLPDLAAAAAELVGVRGYARVDVRVSDDGHAQVLEANANPCLSPDAGFMAAAAEAGLSPEETAGRILDAALRGE